MGQPKPDMRLVEMESNLQLVASREVPVRESDALVDTHRQRPEVPVARHAPVLSARRP